MKHTSFQLWLFIAMLGCTGLHAQMVGIGTNAPTEMLDVNGRMRVRQGSSTSAGIYFDNNYFTNRSFAGIMNADNMGFWGTGTSWHMVMNMNTGNVGIGTTSPTAQLDVNGTLRIRNNAKAGAVMTGLGSSGVIGWVGPVYFVAMGTPTGADLAVNTTTPTYTRAAFASPDLNHGNAWNATNHVFTAPLNGIYHFAAHLQLKDADANLRIQLIRRRNNVNTVLYYAEHAVFAEGNYIFVKRPYELGIDTKLEIGDAVWLEMTRGLSNCTLSGDRAQYYFSGQLIVLQ